MSGGLRERKSRRYGLGGEELPLTRIKEELSYQVRKKLNPPTVDPRTNKVVLVAM